MTWRSFLLGCFRHDPLLSSRLDDQGHPYTVQECATCGVVIPVLPNEAITTGPAHHQQEARGVPNMKAKLVSRGNVREWKVQR